MQSVCKLREVQRTAKALCPLRIGERVLDRQLHIRHAELRDDRAVHQLHHGVHHALRVDEHLNIVGRDAEQVHRLDEFQALVHHRRGIDADLRAHAPVRVLDGLLRRDGRRLLARPAAKRPAGAGEQDFFQLAISPGETLEDGRMLRVHGNDLRIELPGALHDDLARADERLLVGKRNAPPLFNGLQRRAQADRAGHRRDHRLRAGDDRRLAQAALPAADGNVRIRQRNAQRLGRRLVVHRDERRVQPPRLLLHEPDVPVRGQRAHVETEMLRNRDRLPADAARGA